MTRALLIAVGTLVAVYLTIRLGHVVEPHRELPPSVLALLREAGKQAIQSGDVPVAAVLLYGERPIGMGRNTVLMDHDAGGHAEINAVSDAMRKLGRVGFEDLDRDSLVMVTTFEPCAMCRGMLIEYRITDVVYNRSKSLGHWIRDDLRWLHYELSKQEGGPKGLQDSLFRAHPAYVP